MTQIIIKKYFLFNFFLLKLRGENLPPLHKLHTKISPSLLKVIIVVIVISFLEFVTVKRRVPILPILT